MRCTSQPGASGKPAATGATSQAAAPAQAKGGELAITGSVKYTGEKFEMEVPPKRKKAEFCKDKELKHNGVIFAGKDKLQDVFVAIADGQVKGDPKPGATIEQKDCMFVPRIMGAQPKQEITFKNSDPIGYKIKASKGKDECAIIARSWRGLDPVRAWPMLSAAEARAAAGARGSERLP